MKRILHANDPDGCNRLSEVLSGCHVSLAQTMIEAEAQLNKAFDLIIAGVHFDDSRAVEFLHIVRNSKNHKRTPFLFIRTRPSSFASVIQKTIMPLKTVYPFSGYIETDSLEEDDGQIRRAIFGCLKKKNTH